MANLIIIRRLCEERGITIRELAARINRDESSIQSSIRRGSTNTKTLEAIAAELNVPVGTFFDDIVEVSEDAKDAEIAYLKKIIEEKERTIKILLEKEN